MFIGLSLSTDSWQVQYFFFRYSLLTWNDFDIFVEITTKTKSTTTKSSCVLGSSFSSSDYGTHKVDGVSQTPSKALLRPTSGLFASPGLRVLDFFKEIAVSYLFLIIVSGHVSRLRSRGIVVVRSCGRIYCGFHHF